MSEILKIKKNNLEEFVARAAEAIQGGKVIVSPTDTVYGLICDATNQKAVAKIFKIKKRETKNPLPVFAQDIQMAKSLAEISVDQEKILKKSWPGKTTFILRRAKNKTKIYGIKETTIGLRIPNYKLINMLIDKIKKPIIGTSANLAGQPDSTKIKAIVNQFQNQKYQPDIILDANNLTPSKSSKIIDLTNKIIKILRQ